MARQKEMLIAPPLRAVALQEAEFITGRQTDLTDIDALPSELSQRIYSNYEDEGFSRQATRHKYKNDISSTEYMAFHPGQIARSSINSRDALESRFSRNLEMYDKNLDQQLLESADIVKAYNEMIHADFEAACNTINKYVIAVQGAQVYGKDKLLPEYRDIYDKYVEPYTTDDGIDFSRGTLDYATATGYRTVASMLSQVETIMAEVADFDQSDLSNQQIIDWIINAIYAPSDDPEVLKRIINARIRYNNAMIEMFKIMLKKNYDMLNLSQEDAQRVIAMLNSSDQSERQSGIVKAKQAVINNGKKFELKPPCRGYDLRPLGGGVLYLTCDDLADVEGAVKLDRMVQVLFQYDCVVCGHGNDSTKQSDAYFNKIVSDKTAAQAKIQEMEDFLEELEEKGEEDDNEAVVKYLKDHGQYDEFTQAELDDIYLDLDKYPPYVKLNKLEKEEDEKTESIVAKLHDQWETAYKRAFDRNLSEAEQAAYQQMMDEIDAQRAKIRDDHFNRSNEIFEAKQAAIDEFFKRKTNASNAVANARRSADTGVKAKIAKLEDEIDQAGEDFEDMMHDMIKRYDRILRKFKKDSYWSIQPVYTLTGGPFTDVNELVRQLIKEGFKNIQLMSCNPGHHELARDIRNKPGIKITYSENTLMSENVTEPDPFLDEEYYAHEQDPYEEIENRLAMTENHMINICESVGISYFDDDYLDECAQYFSSGEGDEVLTEGMLKNVWNALVKLAKSALGFIIKLFKSVVKFCQTVVNTIKKIFSAIFNALRKVVKGGSSKVNPKRSGAILIEDAKLTEIQPRTWEEMQRNILNACNTISKKIDFYEKRQTENMKTIQKFAENQARTVNESSSPDMDKLLGLIM